MARLLVPRRRADTRLLVEAKRPSVEINSPRPIYQVKAHGCTANIPVALLSDFDALLAVDCRYHPVLSEPQTGLIPEFSLRHGTYVNNWDLLWGMFHGIHPDARLPGWRASVGDSRVHPGGGSTHPFRPC